VGDREGHRKVSAHGVTDQIDALGFDGRGKVEAQSAAALR
jgi:hypothetical protein